jgi:hypothetical protein
MVTAAPVPLVLQIVAGQGSLQEAKKGEVGMRAFVRVETETGDVQELEVLTRHLRQELLMLEVDDVTFARDDEQAEGAKGDAITIGTLVITLANSAVLAGACQVLRTWVTRDQGRRAVVKYEAERPLTLEITGSNVAQQQQLIDSFLTSMKYEQEREI